MSRSISFRFRAGHERQDVLQLLDNAMTGYGMALTSRRIERNQLFSVHDLLSAQSLLFEEEELDSPEPTGVLRLKPERVKALTEAVKYERLEYKTTYSLRAIVVIAAANCFPVLGRDVWLSPKLTLPAGLVRAFGDEASTNALVEHIRGLINQLGLGSGNQA